MPPSLSAAPCPIVLMRQDRCGSDHNVARHRECGFRPAIGSGWPLRNDEIAAIAIGSPKTTGD
jgi:hypothetical protein